MKFFEKYFPETRRFRIFAGVYLGLFLILFGYLFFRQIWERDAYLEKERIQGQRRILKPGARGDVVDDEAMIEALKSKKVFAFGLDVYNGEPKIHPEYLKLDNIFLLPHLGSATKRTRWDMAYRATQNLKDFFVKGAALDKVN